MARILNIMFGKKRGGLEQASVDYHEALFLTGNHEIMSVIQEDAWVEDIFKGFDAHLTLLNNFGEWDPIASYKLSVIAKRFKPDIAICHGNRAIGLALKALKGICPISAVAHNYKTKRFSKCDAAFCITEDLTNKMIKAGMASNSVFHMPNMVRIQNKTRQPKTPSSPPVIGSMGRFVEDKGFDTYIKSLSLLNQSGIPFRAQLGGYGDLSDSYKALALAEKLDDSKLQFIGWVEDKEKFFQEIDIFVLPSNHEPFGIVLIEAMAAGLPCVTADAEGPQEIITHKHDALMVKKGNPSEMAAALTKLIDTPDLAKTLAQNGFDTVLNQYDISNAGQKLETIITQIIKNYKS